MQNSEATSSTPANSTPANSTPATRSPRFVKLIYNHNPFYLISAGLVLYGISSTFQNGQAAIEPWLLASLLSGFITILALTGYLIVRLGRVWDDARSIFMVNLLLFFALSVSFDSLCLTMPNTAILMLSLGFCFSVLVTEMIMLGLKIKFRIRFRIPYYLMLGCTFFFPMLISWQNTHFPDFDTRWVIGAFPLVCALSILAVIPAVRKGSAYVGKNGTPWEWPWFPFAAFVLLVVGLCGRSALLAMAFDPSTGSGSIFGSYFLIPILFACIVAMIEIGIKEKLPTLTTIGFGITPFLTLLAFNGSNDPGQATFYADVTSAIGAPIWLTILAAAMLYAVSAMREIVGATTMLVFAMVAVALTTPAGGVATGLSEVSVWPCLVLSILQVRNADRRSESRNWLIALFWLAPWLGLIAEPLGRPEFPELRAALAGHWLLFAACGVAFWFRDRFAIQLRLFIAFALPVLALGSLLYCWANSLHGWPHVAYVGFIVLFGLAVYQLSSDKLFVWTSTMTFAVCVGSMILKIRDRIAIETEGLAGFLLLSILFFAVGVFVSCLKAGLGMRLTKEFNRMVIDVQERFFTCELAEKNLAD